MIPLAVAAGCDGRKHLDAQAPLWHVTDELRIGSLDGPGALSTIRGIVVSAGRTYVLQPQEQTIRVFDAAGGSLGAIGRRGGGPGEFIRPLRLGLRQGRLWISDPGAGRVVLLDLDGNLLSGVQYSQPVGSYFSPARPERPLADGSMLSTAFPPPLIEERGLVDHALLLRYTSSGELLDTIAMLPLGQRTSIVPGRGGNAVHMLHPLPTGALWEVDATGSRILVATRPGSGAAAGRFRLTALDLSGDTLWSRSYRYTPEPVSRAVADSLIRERAESFLESGPFGSRSEAEAALRQHLDLPEYLPPLTALIVAQDGLIWLRREQRAGADVVWNVFDPNGRLHAVARLPSEAEVWFISSTHVWASLESELGVPQVVRYRISKGGAGRGAA